MADKNVGVEVGKAMMGCGCLIMLLPIVFLLIVFMLAVVS